MLPLPQNLLDTIKDPIKKWAVYFIILSAPFVVAWTYNNEWPSKIVAPIEARVARLETEMNSTDSKIDVRFDGIERYLCFDKRQRAELAGINCSHLIEGK